MIDDVLENALIARLVKHLPRSTSQLNRLHESDAELVTLGDGSDTVLALTTDSIVEEINAGVYSDPYQIGWVTVMANLSDLAAVGARPIGLLLSETLPPGVPEDFVSSLQSGIRDASTLERTAILGGDTNSGDRLSMAATGVGVIPDGKPMMRRGCAVGDILYATGPLGSGNAFAAQRTLGVPSTITYLPNARVEAGVVVRNFASACMDTSDGVLATLDQLGRINNVGFHVNENWDECLDADAMTVALNAGLSPWTLLAGPHGEYELMVTVHPENHEAVEAMDPGGGCRFRRLGQVTATPGVSLGGWGTIGPDDLARLRNLTILGAETVRRYLELLRDIERRCRISTPA